MVKNWLFTAIWATIFLPCFAQQTIQEKLGYAKDAKLLIIHADDLGVAHSEDSASLQLLENGGVSSASIMVPTPWFSEMVAYANKHPDADLGLHLTLTSEWNGYKWGPVAPRDKVSSLLNNEGFFYNNDDSLGKHGTAADVETELRAQIEKALKAGIHVTHLDSHMGSVFFKKEYMAVYVKLAHEYHLPYLFDKNDFKVAYHIDVSDLLTDNDVVMDHIYIANPPAPVAARAAFYTSVLNAMPAGLSYLIIHTAYNGGEMQAVTVDHADYGAAWRQADYDYFSSDACKQALAANHIQVVTWKEIKEKMKL